MSNVGGVSNTQSYSNQYSYSKPSASSKTTTDTVKDPGTIKDLWDKTNAATQSIRDMVEKLIGTSSKGGAQPGQGYWGIRANPDQFNVKVDDATRAEAESMIGENGFFGVTQTTDRIMKFAKALGGENASEETIEKLRAASMKAFDEVAKMFGGFDNLPDVTKKTYDAVVKGFDEWKAGTAA